MAAKEPTATIKTAKLLEAAGWGFFAQGGGPANTCLELTTKFESSDLDALGQNFEKVAQASLTSFSWTPKGAL